MSPFASLINRPPTISSTPPTFAVKGQEFVYTLVAEDPPPFQRALTVALPVKPDVIVKQN
jgi:hypothetical protein